MPSSGRSRTESFGGLTGVSPDPRRGEGFAPRRPARIRLESDGEAEIFEYDEEESVKENMMASGLGAAAEAGAVEGPRAVLTPRKGANQKGRKGAATKGPGRGKGKEKGKRRGTDLRTEGEPTRGPKGAPTPGKGKGKEKFVPWYRKLQGKNGATRGKGTSFGRGYFQKGRGKGKNGGRQ